MNQPKKFALIGVGGYIAVRHLKAIKDTNNVLLASLDRSDSVGIIDSYFPDSHFFVEYERFDRHIDKLRRAGKQIDYVSICSPNYLHDSHIRFALRSGAHAICEKPLVLNPWNIDALQEIENESDKKINNILQLRLHPVLIDLKKNMEQAPGNKKYDIDLTYITSRGNWYFASWKGELQKSGGIATNIGIHFFDMLIWIFGSVQQNIVHLLQNNKASGYLELERARVRWFLSLDANDLPAAAKENGKRTYRSITMNDHEIEFSEGFTDLHTKSYQEILAGRGFGMMESKPSIETVYTIRNSNPVGLKGDYHELCRTVLKK
ncbi:MAG: Gfo/Idh/MocA family oxidoreductase [Bacteroidales bacterium]|nr:Gfo/Idh/MocA family oxidoreductase [Bacteroidales bacterium]MBN2764696.1 Gfo/Idh/MocA family oxidoreductase [Bacteroidales bacterium]